MKIRKYSIVAIFLLISIIAVADNELNSLSENTLNKFITVINENNNAELNAFVQSTYNPDFLHAHSLESHIYFTKNIVQQYGLLTTHSVTAIPTKGKFSRVAALVNSKKTEEWIDLILYFEKNKPSKISGMQFKQTDINKIPKHSDLASKQEIAKELNKYVKRMGKKGVFSGSVLLSKENNIILKKTTGLANRRFNISNNVETKFNLGSMNKMFTAVAIMQLVESGRLSLNDRLSLFIDESWLSKEISQKIQIKHLLSHTAGLGSYFNDIYRSSAKDNFRDLSDYKVLIEGDVLKFKPGKGYAYSNNGMFLLGLVIEKASGEDYFDYIRNHVYLKANMINSGSYDLDQPVSNLATGYLPSFESRSGWRNNNLLLPVKGGPAGGGYSTTGDLHRFSVALLRYKLLNKSLTELLFLEKSELGAIQYGYGFHVEGKEANRIVGHNGRFDGISSNLDIFLDRNYIAVVLSNQSSGAPPIVQKIRWLLFNLKKHKKK